jgi:hypothetical protein
MDGVKRGGNKIIKEQARARAQVHIANVSEHNNNNNNSSNDNNNNNMITNVNV